MNFSLFSALEKIQSSTVKVERERSQFIFSFGQNTIISWTTVEREQRQAGFDYGLFAKVKTDALCVVV